MAVGGVIHRRLAATALSLLAPACSPVSPAAHRASGTTGTTHAASPGVYPDDQTAASVGPAPTTTATTYVITVPTTTTHTHAPVTTKFTLPEAAEDDLSDEERWHAQPGYGSSTREALLACIRSYEQGADGYATDTGNGHYGAYQFDLSTWRSVGGTGNPAHASPAEQDARAWALYLSRGLQPWPTPSRRCS